MLRLAAALASATSAAAQAACSSNTADPLWTAFDAQPLAECTTTGCAAGQYFEEYWDDDLTGCLDSGQTCCKPCDPNAWQAVDSTGDSATRTTTCDDCDEAKDAAGVWVTPAKWVSSGCGMDAQTKSTQTGFTPCAVPSGAQYVSDKCVPGSSDAPGHDTGLTTCSQPNSTQYTLVPCFSGSAAECTVNFPITAEGSNNDFLASLDSCTHAFDGAAKPPQDTALSTCAALTPAGTFVSQACASGAHKTVGSQAVVSDCANPAPTLDGMLSTEWVSTICDPGAATVAGANTVIGKCKMPEDTGYLTGTYIIEECMPGTSTSSGSDAVLRDCDDMVTQSDGCPINNLECQQKCEVGTGTWVGLFILLMLFLGGSLFGFLYVTENALVMGGECRRGFAFEATTVPDRFITASDPNPTTVDLTTGLRLAAVDWMGEVATKGNQVALFVECRAGGSYATVAMASGAGYRLCNNTLSLAPGSQVKLSEQAGVEADRCARLKSSDGLLPEELKGGLAGPIGRGIEVVWTTDSEKGLEFMLEGALNGDMQASSISCRMIGEDGRTEEKYYLRHDEAKLVLQRDTHADDNASSWFVRKPEHVAVLMGKPEKPEKPEPAAAAEDDYDEEEAGGAMVMQRSPMYDQASE